VVTRLGEVARSSDSSEAVDGWANVLRDLMLGRSGMTQAYVGFPDGTFLGVYQEVGDEVRFQESRIAGVVTKMRHFTFGRDGLVVRKEEQTNYDPRQRGWYTLAVKQRARVWTPPYPFFTTRHTGITRAEPVYEAGRNGKMKAVVGVDFDASALSTSFADADQDHIRVLIFGEDGVVLGYPAARARIEKLRPTDHALNYRDLDDPLLDAFFTRRPDPGEESRLGRFDVGGVQREGGFPRIELGRGPGFVEEGKPHQIPIELDGSIQVGHEDDGVAEPHGSSGWRGRVVQVPLRILPSPPPRDRSPSRND